MATAKQTLKETLERVSGVTPITGVIGSMYSPCLYVWGKDRKIVEVATDKLSEVTIDDFFSMCDEDLSIDF